jgi:hypothetical protein
MLFIVDNFSIIIYRFIETTAELQAHVESGEHVQKSEAIEESCPLCPQKSSTLRAHLLEDHKISEIVIDKLMVSTVATTSEETDKYVYSKFLIILRVRIITIHKRTFLFITLLSKCKLADGNPPKSKKALII